MQKINYILSRYSPRYIRSLVYMLQASEYKAAEFLSWFHRTADFANVEKRKKLIPTAKAILLIILSWIIVAGIFISAMSSFININGTLKIIVPIALVIIAPFLLAYSLAFIAFLINLTINRPAEYFALNRAKEILKNHKGFKIAIAGSFGKTTMREILKAVISEGKKVAAPAENFNTPLGISRFINSLKGDEEILIFELGEYYPGDVMRLAKVINPDIGIITGVNEAHLEKFKTVDSAAATIFELADFLKDKPLYVNGENVNAKKYASKYPSNIFYSREGAGDFKVLNTRSDISGTYFTLSDKTVPEKNPIDIHSRLLGSHQIGPLATAAAIARHLGLSDEKIKNGLDKTVPFDHRLEPKTDSTGVTILDDSYNGNPDGTIAVIDFLSSVKDRRRFYMTPGLVEMGSRAAEAHESIGRHIAASGIENVILIKNSVTPYIEKGLKEADYKGKIIWFDNALSAFAALPMMTVAGDIVLMQNDWPDQYA